MTLKHTPLHARHLAHGAKMTDFGGWDMPVRYAGDKKEHACVREAVGLFDVSHMGEVWLEGPRAKDAVQILLTNDADRIVDGQAMYAGMLDERGCFVDDVVAYRFSETRFLVVVNASNRDKDVAWMTAQLAAHVPDGVTLTDESDAWGQIAIQGPQAEATMVAAGVAGAAEIGRFRFAELSVPLGGDSATHAIVARTGYTGEDGFELYMPAADTEAVWNALLAAGADHGIQPCGLGARDTLRLEAGLALYGNDIDAEHTPVEAALSWIVKLDKEPAFIGKEAIVAQKAAGITRRLRALTLKGRGIARHGYDLYDGAGEDAAKVGVVTSGTMAPHLGAAIGLAYVDLPLDKPGSTVFVDIRGRRIEAEVARTPLYKRPQ